MKIIKVEAGPVQTIGYLVIDESTGKSVVIDVPLDGSYKLVEAAKENNADICAIFLTHSHWDHLGETAELQKLTNARVYVHASDEYRLTEPNEHSIWKLPFKIEAVKYDKLFENGDYLQVGNMNFEVLHTPGHTEGGVCFVEHNEKVVFSGDTLFQDSIGRTDLPGGDIKTLLNSIREKLFSLPPDYTVFPGHGQPTTIGYEKKFNPFLNEM